MEISELSDIFYYGEILHYNTHEHYRKFYYMQKELIYTKFVNAVRD